MKSKTFLIFLAICITLANCSNWKGKCNIVDTVNITEGYEDNEGNFIFQGIKFAQGTYGESDYFLLRAEKIHTQKHIRGCICLYKPCIRICCSENCENQFPMEVPSADESLFEIEENDFGVLKGMTCSSFYQLEPSDYEFDKWWINPVNYLFSIEIEIHYFFLRMDC